jgi:hypothetical protein
MKSMPRRLLRRAMLASSIAAMASACGVLTPPGALALGTPIDEARHAFGGPNGQYALPGGGTRLEFRQYKQTYMLDFDAAGRLVAKQQVLTPAIFATLKPGMTRADVLSRIGHPVGVFPVGYQKLQVWNYRFGAPEGDCVLFQVSISNSTGLVTELGPGMDPACDAPSREK